METKRRRIICNLVVAASVVAFHLLNDLLEEDRDPYERKKDIILDWWSTPWGKLVRSEEVKDPNSREGKSFRNRFRLPFNLFEVLVDLCRNKRVFGAEQTAAGLQAMPVELKVMGALRTLGRGTLHDDVAEITGAVKEVHRLAFLKFISFIANELRNEWINVPVDGELRRVLEEYERLGFPGCVGSMDATHIHWARCPTGAVNEHKGKEGYPTRAFNVTVTHHGKVYAVSKSQPGARNDKTIVRYDKFAEDMRLNGLFADLRWSVRKRDGTLLQHKGGYVITDNGYHHWKMFCCPWKIHSEIMHLRWSRWIESCRKDVECFFGRLKMRFRCLLNPIYMKDESDIDNMFITCCILHNMLLSWDGLDTAFDNPETWNYPDDEDTSDEPQQRNIFSLVQQRAIASTDMTYVWSGSQTAGTVDSNRGEEDFYNRREDLVGHFSYLFERKQLIWLSAANL